MPISATREALTCSMSCKSGRDDGRLHSNFTLSQWYIGPNHQNSYPRAARSESQSYSVCSDTENITLNGTFRQTGGGTVPYRLPTASSSVIFPLCMSNSGPWQNSCQSKAARQLAIDANAGRRTPAADTRKQRRTGLRSCLVDALQVRPPACGLDWPAVCRALDIQHTVPVPSECASPFAAPFRMDSAPVLLRGPELPPTTQHDRSRRYGRKVILLCRERG
ncbi:hypothetical protein GE09DRAFT_738990 [Coniochaeta sp. 2T2.1]|nr:hypothetical protein GE09DRAFT_738990 [Coniochaeta sp. 2T2.1]